MTDYQYDSMGRRTMETVAGRSTKYEYDSMGRLTKVIEDSGTGEDKLNLTTQYTYDGHGLLETVTNPLGTVTKYEYDHRNRLWKVTEDYGSGVGHVNQVTEYAYDGNGNKTWQKDPNGKISTFQYNLRNDIKRSVDAEGYETLYTHAPNHYDDFLWRDRGRNPGPGGPRDVVRYKFDDLKRVTEKIVDPNPEEGGGHLELTTQYDYNPADCGCGGAGGSVPKTVTDPAWRVTEREFDLLGRVWRVTRQSTSGNAVTTYTYDPEGNLLKTVGPEGETTIYTYDGAGRMLKEWKLANPPDEPGESDPTEPASGDLLTTFTWDDAGNLTTVVLPNGHTLTADYDGGARLRHVYDGAGPSAPVLAAYIYDAGGNVVSRKDGLGRTWEYQYDALGRVMRESDPIVESPTDKYTTHQYDGVGNLVLTVNNNGVWTRRQYDALNRLVKVIEDADPDWMPIPFPSQGEDEPQPLDGEAVGGVQGEEVLEPGGEGGGNPMGPPMALLAVSTPTRNTTTEYVYDGSRMTALKDHDGNTTTYAYDAAGRVTAITYPPCTSQPSGDQAPCQVAFTYEANHRDFRRIDQRGITTDYQFDDLGHLYRRAYGGAVRAREETFSFDRSGRLTSANRLDYNDGLLFDWARTYDKLGRPKDETQTFAEVVGGPTAYATTFTYDIDRDNHETAWTMTTPSNRQVRHTLDRLNRLDEAAMLDDQSQTLAGATWTHDAAGQRISATLANGVHSAWDYDADGRLNWASHVRPMGGQMAEILFDAEYGYDASGNRTFTRQEFQPERGERYGYDNLNRLTLMERGELNEAGSAVVTPISHSVLASNQQWANLDRRGNWLDYRWAMTHLEGEAPAEPVTVAYQQTRTANGVNEYTAVDPDGPPAQGQPANEPAVTPVYDAAGNLLFDVMPWGAGVLAPVSQQYSYDEENRLTEVRRHADGDPLVRYEYDALGRRVQTIEYVDAATGLALSPPRKTRQVYVGLETAEEYDVAQSEEYPYPVTATLLREFVWGDPARFPEPVAMIDHTGAGQASPSPCQGEGGGEGPGCVYHYLHDVLGSVIGLTDSTGSLVERYTYDPYGKPLVERLTANGYELTASSAFGNPFLWTGQRYDAAAGLYAFLCRSYSPSLGRWLQRDPIGYAGGSINLYEYVLGNPLASRDPFGLWGDGCNYLRSKLNAAKKELNDLNRVYPPGLPLSPDTSCEVGAQRSALASNVQDLETEVANCKQGHSDMPGNKRFDWTKEDHRSHHPWIPWQTWRHFRMMKQAQAAVDEAIRKGDKDAFERAVHRGQDTFSHKDAGFTWWKHFLLGDEPDDSRRWRHAYQQASDWTQQQVDKWDAAKPPSPPSIPGVITIDGVTFFDEQGFWGV